MGSYEVVRKLARGGMADLFLARTVTDTFERLVVIKKILPRFADNPRFVQLFHDEAKLAASLKHKNIVEVFDIGGAGGELYFAMEYLHGQDVRSILHRAWKRNEKMPIGHAVQVAIQTASALHYAHEKRRPDGTLLNVVHRDVSPSNVIVAYDGATKLLDFGVAKAATSTIKTRTGTLKGKIAYMSPEQAKGGSVDRRSDLFSLGIVLWEMITTSRLFRGENDLATLQLIINEAPKKPSEVNPECPKDLERIVLRALAQDPNTRYQTALELQQELEEFVRQHQMVQSSTALGMFMSVLFQPEIASWKEAEAAGVELSQHLTTGDVAELTTAVSESEFIEPDGEDDDYEEDADEDDLAQASISGTIQDDLDGVASATLPQTVEIHGGKRKQTSTPMPLMHVQQREIPLPIGKQGSAPMLRPVLGVVSAPILPASIIVRDQTPPPRPVPPAPAMAPLMQSFHAVSVPSPDTLPFSDEQAARLRKQFITVGATVLGLIFVVALIKACSGNVAPTRAKAVVDPADAAVVEMTTTPPDPVVTLPPPPPVPIDAAVAVPQTEPKRAPPPIAKPLRKRPPPSTTPAKKPQDGRNKPFLR